MARQLTSSGGETSSPLMPAHTQVTAILRRREGWSILNQMLIHQLSPLPGSLTEALTAAERNLALKIGGAGEVPALVEHNVLDVKVKVHKVFMQVPAGY